MTKPIIERVRIAVVVIGFVVPAGCSTMGSGTGAFAAYGSSFSAADERNLTTSPRSVDFRNGRSQIVRIVGGAPPYTIVQSNPAVATLSPSPTANAEWSFVITSIAGGRTVVTVTDSESNSTTVPATQAICLPPVVAVVQVDPKSGATNVPTDLERIVFKTNASVGSGEFPNDFARLVGADGSVVTGGYFRHVAPPHAAGSKYDYWRAALPALESEIAYRVQYADAKLTCLPPAFTGTFTTK
jgi:hypothetical protein